MPKLPIGDVLGSVEAAFKSGKILKADFETFKNTFNPELGNVDDAMQALRENAKRKSFEAAKNAEKFEEHNANMKTVEDQGSYIASRISSSWKNDKEFINLDKRGESINDYLKRNTIDFDEAMSTRVSKFLQFDKVKQDQFIYSVLEPENPSNTKEMLKMGSEVSDMLDEGLSLFNKEGGAMKRIEGVKGRYLPQLHDSIKMLQVSKTDLPRVKGQSKKSRLEEEYKVASGKWVDFVMPRLNYDRMRFNNMSEQQIRDVLNESFDTIVSNGQNKVDEIDLATFSAGKATANKNQEARELHFKGAKNWIDYKDLYGNADIYKTVTDYVRSLSMDTAAMQVFGTNPRHMMDKLMEVAKQNNKLGGIEKGFIDGMFKVATGAADSSEVSSKFSSTVASTAGTFRSFGVASDLGSAVVSSITDVSTSSLAAGMTGQGRLKTFTSQMGTVFRRVARGMSVSEKEKFAAQIGVASELFMSSIRNNRFSEGGGWKKMQKIAEGVLRSSGLTAWTAALRTTFSFELAGYIGKNIGKTLESFQYGKILKDVYGVTEEDWAKVTMKHTRDFEGNSYLDTTAMFKDMPELSMKLSDAMKTETNFAVIMPDSRIRAITTGGGSAKGTVAGEVARSTFMYKSFPIAMMVMHLGRISGIKTATGKAAYTASLVIQTTLMGTLALQLKEIIKGREPKGAKTKEEWAKLLGAGFIQGGGAGLIGDFLFHPQTRYGGSPAATLFLGKAAQPIDDLTKIKEAALGQSVDKNPGAKLIEKALNYVPGRNLWYTRLIYEREFADQVKRMSNPDYDAKLRRHLRKLKKETGQTYWAKPGEHIIK